MHIHMAWVGTPPPPAAIKAVSAVQRLNPSCTVNFWTTREAVRDEWKAAFDRVSFSPHLQSDILRHSVLRTYGGLWLDVDVVPMVQATVMAAGWSGYTAVRLAPSGFIGTDILYAEPGWNGWAFFDEYLASVTLTPPVSGVVLAHQMVDSCLRAGAPIAIVADRQRFPCISRDATPNACALRCGVKLPAAGLGDMVAAGLSAVGITKDRVQAVAQAVGVKDCGCPGRQAALNRLGAKLGLPPGTTAAS